MRESKTFIKIDSCERVIDDILMKTTPCTHKEISRVWFHIRDFIIIGAPNYIWLTDEKKNKQCYIAYASRTENKDESADAVYASTKPKGGPRSHKKKTPSPEDYVPEMVA